MKIRVNELWNVPVFCVISSWISFYLTVYLGRFFFVVTKVGADGVTSVSTDPVRSMLFDAALFLLVLFVGGLRFFRSMTKAEIAISAGITSAIYLAIVLAQLFVSDFPTSMSVALAYVQDWTGILASMLLKLTNQLEVSVIAASFAPMLFVPFGRKSS